MKREKRKKALREELTTQIQIKVGVAVDAVKKFSAHLEVKIEAERARSMESAKESLEEQLQLVNSEAAKLQDIVTALEHKYGKRRRNFSAELHMQLEALEAIKKKDVGLGN